MQPPGQGVSAAASSPTVGLPTLAGLVYAWAMTTIYGIPNCDTMKKARTWLADRGVDVAFHDYKKAGVDRARLQGWVEKAGWETLLNRSGTTFRALPEADRADITESKAIDLMLAQPSMIKRPVLETRGDLLVGFKPEAYAERFKAGA